MRDLHDDRSLARSTSPKDNSSKQNEAPSTFNRDVTLKLKRNREDVDIAQYTVKKRLSGAADRSSVQPVIAVLGASPTTLTLSRRSINHTARVKMMKNESQRIFQCSYCPCSYMDRTGLYRHTIRLHPEKRKNDAKSVAPAAKGSAILDNPHRNDVANVVEQDGGTTMDSVSVTDVVDYNRDHSSPVTAAAEVVNTFSMRTSPLNPTATSESTLSVNDVYVPRNASDVGELPTHESKFVGLGSLLVSESTINLLLEDSSGAAQSKTAGANSQQPNSTQGPRSVIWPSSMGVGNDGLGSMVADVFASEGSQIQTWRLPAALLSSDYEANRWIHDVTLQVLAASVNHMSSRLRRLIVEGVANGHGNELRKIASFCMSLERVGRCANGVGCNVTQQDNRNK
jgi:hypothetical protein